MKNILKRLWFPTELDNIGARYFYLFLLPVLSLLGVFLKIPILIGIIILVSFILRAIIVVRSSITLPIDCILTERYRRITPRKRRNLRYLSIVLPVLPFAFLIIEPNYFLIAFLIAAFVSFSMLPLSDLPQLQFVLISLILVLSSLFVALYQGGSGATVIWLIFFLLVVPETLSMFMKMKRLEGDSRTHNLRINPDPKG